MRAEEARKHDVINVINVEATCRAGVAPAGERGKIIEIRIVDFDLNREVSTARRRSS